MVSIWGRGMIKRFGIYVAIAVAWGIAYVAKQLFGLSDVWMAIIVIVVLILLITMTIESRLLKLEARVIHKDYSGIIAQLEGERHVPRHRQPESLAAGGAIKSWIRPEHETLFEDFQWFGTILNRHRADPWSIEELPSTDARGYDGREIGRMYEVWYNACKVGRFQVTLGSGALLRRDKSEDKRSARIDLDLDYLRFIPYQDARGLLYELALMVGPFDRNDGNASRAKGRRPSQRTRSAAISGRPSESRILIPCLISPWMALMSSCVIRPVTGSGTVSIPWRTAAIETGEETDVAGTRRAPGEDEVEKKRHERDNILNTFIAALVGAALAYWAWQTIAHAAFAFSLFFTISAVGNRISFELFQLRAQQKVREIMDKEGQ